MLGRCVAPAMSPDRLLMPIHNPPVHFPGGFPDRFIEIVPDPQGLTPLRIARFRIIVAFRPGIDPGQSQVLLRIVSELETPLSPATPICRDPPEQCLEA